MTFRVKINFSFNFLVFLCNIRHEKINLIWLTTWNLSLCNWYYLGILPKALSWLWTHHVLVSAMIVGFAVATMMSWMTAVSTLYVNEQLVSRKTTACTLCYSQLQNYRWNILTMQLFNTSYYLHNRMLAAMQCATVCLYLLGLRTDLIRGFSSMCAPLSFFLPGHFDYFGLSGPLLPLCTASPNAIRFCSVLFLLVLRLARNLTSTECWEFRIGWQECTTTSTLSADFTQWFFNPSTLLDTEEAHQSLWENNCMKYVAGEADPTQRHSGATLMKF